MSKKTIFFHDQIFCFFEKISLVLHKTLFFEYLLFDFFSFYKIYSKTCKIKNDFRITTHFCVGKFDNIWYILRSTRTPRYERSTTEEHTTLTHKTICRAMKPTISKKWMVTLVIALLYFNSEIQGMNDVDLNEEESNLT